MKKTLSIILAVVMLLGMFVIVPVSGTEATTPAEGAAIAVKTEAEFLAMDPAGNYYLDADITLTKTYGLPEGEITAENQPKVFTGKFDGMGHTVTITNQAMFAEAKDATIQNVIVNGEINATEIGYKYDSDADYSEIKLIGYDFYASTVVVADGATVLRNITSNVNFTSTLSNTRYGGIAAEARTGHKLRIEGCINNGDIEANSYVGGIFGWSAVKGDSIIVDCVNNGNIHITAGYCGGISSRLSGSGDGGHLTVERCVNNGDVTADKSNACGIVQYSNTPITIRGCINNGDITANGAAGGIHSSLADFKTVGDVIVEYCINNGNITNKGSGYATGIICNVGSQTGKASASTPIRVYIRNNMNFGDVTNEKNAKDHVAGICSYVWASGNKCYATVENNINYGTIKISSTGNHYASQIIAYTNSDYTEIINNVGLGKTVGPQETRLAFIGMSSANATKYVVYDNYYVEDSGIGYYAYTGTATNTASQIPLTNIPKITVEVGGADVEKNALSIMKAEDMLKPEFVAALNATAGTEAFEVKDDQLLLVCKHNYHVTDGMCDFCGAVIPFTGDNSVSVVMIVATMAVSFVGIVGVAVYFNRKKKIAE